MNAAVSFTTPSGRPLQLGSALGKGGEGKIFNVEDDPGVAVKIYTDGKEQERLPKVRAMVADHLADKTRFVSFPRDIVLANGRFAGFVMRKVVAAKPLFDLCITSARKSEFPDANYRFLVRVALNYARAIASLHALGTVVGDINESGALVNRQGLVTLIDSDSFQYSSDGKTYRCLVGKPEYTPPELQGRPLRDVDRSTHHDAFGLAVILFELLFLGRHPFQGIPRDSDQPTIAEAIAAHRFAYSPHKAVTRMDPPRHMPVLTDMPPEVATAFQRAFGPYPGGVSSVRPSAAEWVRLLEAMESNIVECRVNPSHYHSRSATSCPWCRLEAGYGTVLFVYHARGARSSFDLEEVLGRIHAIASPGPAPDLMASQGSLPPPSVSPRAQSLKMQLLARRCGGLAAAGLAVLLMVIGTLWAGVVLVPAALLFFSASWTRKAIIAQKAAADQRWQATLADWEKAAGPHRFDERRAELARVAGDYRELKDIERQKLAELEQRKQELQMRKHLESHKIEAAAIDKIGDSRKLALRSFGIETAWDITDAAVLAIPGFGPALTANLLKWRQQIERRFHFNPAIPTDPMAIAQVKSDIAMRRSVMQMKLLNGIRDLTTLKAEALARRQDTEGYREACLAHQQAQADWRYLS